MSSTLKVRDRTTNKVRDALVDQEDFERLKDNKYLTDKNSKEPFRESSVNGKRQRVALKRDVMNFSLGDPRRVCYVDKEEVFDCRKSNLSTNAKQDTEALAKPVVKISKASKSEAVKVKEVTNTPTPTPTPTPTTVIAGRSAEVWQVTNERGTAPESKLVLPDTLDVKRSLVSQLGEDKLLELVSVEALLGAWAEKNGYKKQA